jgi:signal transduction histidine kinase
MHGKKRRARIVMLVACELAVAGLGWWQHRSIDALSRSETQVLKSAMRERANAFVEGFDRQIQGLISALAPGAMGSLETSAADLAASLDQWRSTGTEDGLVLAVWLGRWTVDNVATAQRWKQWLRLDGQRWAPDTPPRAVRELCETTEPESPLRILAPAIVLPVMSQPPGTGTAAHGCLAALLDRQRLTGRMVQSLIRKYVAGADGDRYFYTIRELSGGKTIAGELRGQPEVRLPFLFARQNLLSPAIPPPVSLPSKRPVIMPLVAAATNQPHWELLMGLMGGSVEDQVRSARKLNLAVIWTLTAALGIALIAIQKALERSDQLQSQQNQFVAAVSHELRTPLAAIRTLAQNQADGMVTNPGQTTEYGKLLVEEADRLHATFEHCLSFAGVQSVAIVAAAPFDVADAARTMCARFRADHPGARITYMGEEHALLSCSRVLLEQALHNLLDNSRKFARSGEVIVEVSVVRQANELVIAVRDEGIGVSPDEVSQLGTPFFRGRYARDRQIAGLGLGLSLVRSFVERNGGHLRMERRDAGLTVSLTLPIR